MSFRSKIRGWFRGNGAATLDLDERGLADKPAPTSVVLDPTASTTSAYGGAQPPEYEPKPVPGTPGKVGAIHESPLQRPGPSDRLAARRSANLDQAALGVSGTANLMGFLQDLGEYNADLRGLKAMQKFEQMRRSDAIVGSLEAVIKLVIRAADWSVEPGVDKSEPGFALAKELAEFARGNLFGGLESMTESGAKRTQTFESVIENALLCAPFGCSAHEYLWAVDGAKVRLRGLAPRLPLTFYQFITDQDGETLKTLVQFGYRGAIVQIAPVPAEKIDLFTLNREGAYFYGRSIFRHTYMPWFFKQHIYRFMAIQAEKNALAIPVITQGQNASPDDVSQSWQWTQNLATNERTGLSLPFGWTFDAKWPTGRPLDLAGYINLLNEEIYDSGLAGFLSLGKTASGSRSLGDTKLELFLISEQALARMIGEVITNGAIRALVDFNYGDVGEASGLPRESPRRLPYPKLVAGNIAVVNPMDLASAIKDLANANVDWLQTSDERDNYLAKKFGIPAKTKEGRVKYALIVQRIQEMIEGGEEIPTEGPSGEPQKTEGGKQKAEGGGQSTEGGKQKAESTRQKAAALPSGRTGVPARQRQRASGSAELSSNSAALLAGRLRDRESPFWRDGHDPRLRMVHSSEQHVDFPSHQAALDRCQASLARTFSSRKRRLARQAANSLAHAAKTGASVSSVAPSKAGIQQLRDQVAAEAQKIYEFARSEARAEHDRLRQGSGAQAGSTGVSPVQHGQDARATVGATLAAKRSKPELAVDLGVDDVQTDIANAARKAAIDAQASGKAADLSEAELSDELYADILDTAYIDSGIEKTASELSASSFRAGKSDAYQEIRDELAKLGVEVKTIRIAILDPNVCGPCESADGEEVDPGADLSAICEGGAQCRCEEAEVQT
jgi:hypothetical protein